MHSKLLTPEANEALNWLIDRMPDSIFTTFSTELDASIRKIAIRFGLDEKLLREFKVDRLVTTRELLIAADNTTKVFQAHIYGGKSTYAVIDTGTIFHKCAKGNWRPSKLSLDDVINNSITRITAPVKIKVKYI